MPTVEIPRDNIIPSKLNPRKTAPPAERIREIADSIKTHGILENLIVRKAKKGFELVVGETRWKAAGLVKLKTVPCVVKEFTDAEALEVMLIENMHRNDLSPIEEADGIRNMADLSKKAAKEIAAVLGKSVSFVSQRLRVSDLPEVTKKAVVEDKIPLSLALYVGRIADKQAQIDATKFIIGPQAKNWNLDDATDYIRSNFLLELANAPFDPSDAKLPRSWDDDKPGSCAKCPFNSSTDKELFADLGKDARCTKPDCFKGKKDAAWKLTLAEAKEKEYGVIPAKDSAAMFYQGGQLSFEAEREYTDLGRPIHINGKSVDVEKVAGGKVGISIAQRPDGSVAKLAKKADVLKALKAAGIVESKSSKSDAEKELDLRSKAQKREHVLLVQAILDASDASDTARLIIGACKPHTTGQRAQFVQKIKGWDKGAEVEKETQALAVTNDNALLLVLANLEFYGIGQATEDLAALLKIDREAIKKQALAEVGPKPAKIPKTPAAIVEPTRRRRSQEPKGHARRKRA